MFSRQRFCVRVWLSIRTLFRELRECEVLFSLSTASLSPKGLYSAIKHRFILRMVCLKKRENVFPVLEVVKSS